MCQHLARKLDEKGKQSLSNEKQASPEESLQRVGLLPDKRTTLR